MASKRFLGMWFVTFGMVIITLFYVLPNALEVILVKGTPLEKEFVTYVLVATSIFCYGCLVWAVKDELKHLFRS